VRHTVAGFGLLIFSIVALVQLSKYFHYRGSVTIEILIGILACLFFILGWFIKSTFIKRSTLPEPSPAKLPQNSHRLTGLSKREFQILKLIADGFSNQQIADSLFISENTVKKHVSRIFDKLNVERRTQAIRRAQEMHIL
jgi:DNA-binding CsgD family transcriptional regulator